MSAAKHVSQEILREFRESLTSDEKTRAFHLKYPDFCESTMEHFDKVGRFISEANKKIENAATKEDLKESQRHTEKLVIDIHKNTLEMIEANKKESDNRHNYHERRHNDLESRFQQVEYMARSTQSSSERAVDVGVQTLSIVTELSGKLGDIQGEIGNLKVKQVQSSKAKPNAMSNLSNKQLILVGVGISIGLIAALEYLFTGESTIIKMAVGG